MGGNEHAVDGFVEQRGRPRARSCARSALGGRNRALERADFIGQAPDAARVPRVCLVRPRELFLKPIALAEQLCRARRLSRLSSLVHSSNGSADTERHSPFGLVWAALCIPVHRSDQPQCADRCDTHALSLLVVTDANYNGRCEKASAPVLYVMEPVQLVLLFLAAGAYPSETRTHRASNEPWRVALLAAVRGD